MLIDMCNMELKYYNEFEFYCLRNCCRLVLEYYGVSNAQFYVNCSLDMHISKAEAEVSGFIATPITDTGYISEPFICNSDKVILWLEHGKNPTDVWNKNKAKLHDNIPVITFVDLFYIDYQPLFYNKEHGFHSFILSGYTANDENAYIIDWYQPHWHYIGEMGMERYINARSSDNPRGINVASGFPIGNSWLEIMREGWSQNTPLELTYNTLRYSMHKYFDFASEKYDKNIISGIDALKTINNIFIQNCENEKEQVKKLVKEVYGMLFMLPKNRRLFNYYLKNALNEISVPQLKRVIDFNKDCILDYERLLLLMMKFDYEYKKEAYLKIVNLFKSIVDKEELLYDLLYSALNELHK